MGRTVVDLFCGAGGFSEGFRQEGYEILLGVDSEQNKINTFRKNIKPKRTLKHDISQLTAKKILETINHNKIDVLIGSPPCKDFSMSTIRNSMPFLQIGRASLPYHFYRLVVTLKPTWFIMENVERFFSSPDGELFQEIFSPYGYKVTFHLLKACDFGVPQKRIRGFLIGNNLGLKLDLNPLVSNYVTIEEAVSDLLDIPPTGDIKLNATLSSYQLSRRNLDNTAANHLATNHTDEVVEILSKIAQGQSRREINGIPQTKSSYSGAWYRPYYNQPSRTISTRFDTPAGDGDSVHPLLDRCFTPREAARLQSFDDSFSFYGSREEVRIQIGDAVPPLVAKAIAKSINQCSF